MIPIRAGKEAHLEPLNSQTPWNGIYGRTNQKTSMERIFPQQNSEVLVQNKVRLYSSFDWRFKFS